MLPLQDNPARGQARSTQHLSGPMFRLRAAAAKAQYMSQADMQSVPMQLPEPTSSLKAASAKVPTTSCRPFQPRSPPWRALSSLISDATVANCSPFLMRSCASSICGRVCGPQGPAWGEV